MSLLIDQQAILKDGVDVIRATSRQALIDFMGKDTLKDNTTYLHVELRNHVCCGGSVDYATEADVPYHSVPCPCGNPKHWLIKYEVEE